MAEKWAVVIAGASKGIGAELVQRFRSQGHKVVALARSFEPPGGQAPRPRKGVLEIGCDVAQPESVDQAFATIRQSGLKPGVLINSAGIGIFKPIEELGLDEWRATLDTNLSGAFYLVRQAARMFKARRGGRIIHIGSLADHIGFPESAAYAASKFGLRGLCEVSNNELSQHNVHSTLVSLGAVWTDIWKGRAGFRKQDMLQTHEIAGILYDIASLPLSVRVDAIKIVPKKGVL